MRENVIHFALKHPVTIPLILLLGGFMNYNQAAVWACEMRRQDRLRYVGSMKNRVGRPSDVFCGWQPKRDNLRHEIKATEFCLCYPEGTFRRGYDVGPLRPDIEMELYGHTYYIEIDCGTMSRPRVQRRWAKYKKLDPDKGTVLIVAVSNPRKGIDSSERIGDLLRWSGNLFPIAVFTTLETVQSDPMGLVYWDAESSISRAIRPQETPT